MRGLLFLSVDVQYRDCRSSLYLTCLILCPSDTSYIIVEGREGGRDVEGRRRRRREGNFFKLRKGILLG